MSRNRWAKQRDLNEPEIIAALKQCGCDVEQGDLVDLMVGRAGLTFLLEVKRPDRKSESKIRPVQKRLRSSWRGHYAIVSTVAEALRAVGLARAQCDPCAKSGTPDGR